MLTWPRLRARYPSRKSPAAATRYSRLAMNVRSGLKLSMKYSTSGITTTRPIVTRFGRLVTSRRRLDGIGRALPLRRVQQDHALALADHLERRLIRVRRRRRRRGRFDGRAVRDQPSHPADQP